MKLHILSDLHLEFSNFKVPYVDAQILILAGDIAKGIKGVEFAKKLSNRYEHILYVLGNHEFYGYDLPVIKEKIKSTAKETNIHVLDNDVFSFEGVDFIGSTLWTDFELYSKDSKSVEVSKEIASKSLNDFNFIKYEGNRFTVEKSAELCLENKNYLIEQLEKSKAAKKVVITHHCPSKSSISKQYGESPLNSAFASDLDEIILKSDFWIHGHTHSEFDYLLGKSRVICNPRGYSKYQHKQENNDFINNKVIEI